MAVLSLIEWYLSCFGLKITISVTCVSSWVAMMNPRGEAEADMPDDHDECAGAYGAESHPDDSGLGKTNYQWENSSVSSQSSLRERRLGKAAGAHPESQQSSPTSSIRTSPLSQSRHAHQGHSANNPAGMPANPPPYETPGTFSERRRHPPDVTSLRSLGPVPSYDTNAFPPSFSQGGSLAAQHGSLPTFNPSEMVSNTGYHPNSEQILGQRNLQDPTQANIRRPGPDVTNRRPGPVPSYDTNAFPPSLSQGGSLAAQHGSLPTFGSPEMFSNTGYHPYSEQILGQRYLQDPTQANIRHPGPLSTSWPLPQGSYMPDPRSQALAHINLPTMQTTVNTHYAADTGAKLRENPSQIVLMNIMQQPSLQDGRLPIYNQNIAPGTQPNSCNQAGDRQPPESWISNRPETEGAPSSGRCGREAVESKFPSRDLHKNLPSGEPEPQTSMKKIPSKVILRKQKVEKLRDQHRQIKQDCSLSLKELYAEFVELSQVEEVMDLWHYDSTRPRAASLVGFYQWYYKETDPSINRLIKDCKGIGDDSAGHHVFKKLTEDNLKTGNLILYFKDVRRLDIVERLREHHHMCPVCDQLVISMHM